MYFKKTTLIALSLLLSACQEVANPSSGSAALESGDYCYRNIFTNGDTTDMEELLISIDGKAAKGSYNWLPQFKDQRKGSIEGTVSEQTITATYNFNQEGQSQSVDLTIALTDKDATVKGGAPELGLNRTLNKVEC
ncbi:hypothetical protein [Ahrensia kielensis]|uniref:hypothetical protein n=1 Tax=Ahrensia kielensis TaxID=76980 RepID=UPI00035E059E|nr:hypothetical protein [Ahrensia kielensis]